MLFVHSLEVWYSWEITLTVSLFMEMTIHFLQTQTKWTSGAFKLSLPTLYPGSCSPASLYPTNGGSEESLGRRLHHDYICDISQQVSHNFRVHKLPPFIVPRSHWLRGTGGSGDKHRALYEFAWIWKFNWKLFKLYDLVFLKRFLVFKAHDCLTAKLPWCSTWLTITFF